MISRFEIQPFIATLAAMFLARGLCLVITDRSIAIDNSFFQSLNLAHINLWQAETVNLRGRVRISDVYTTPSVLVALVLVVVAFVVLHYTRFGRTVYAVGGNEPSSRLMGLRVDRTKISVYVISGFCAGVAGLLFAFYTASGDPVAGIGYELNAIAAVVIGGTLLSGGSGYVLGSMLGVLVLATIYAYKEFDGDLNTGWTRIMIGVLVLFFIVLQRLVATRREDDRAESQNCRIAVGCDDHVVWPKERSTLSMPPSKTSTTTQRARPPGMYDVARLAGVSHQTVSRVINAHPSVREDTRRRVQAAIDELGYRRNVAARTLVTRRSNTIGVITSVSNFWGPSSTLIAVERAARDAGMYVSVAGLRSIEPAGVGEVLRHFADQGVEGIVVIAPGGGDGPHGRTLHHRDPGGDGGGRCGACGQRADHRGRSGIGRTTGNQAPGRPRAHRYRPYRRPGTLVRRHRPTPWLAPGTGRRAPAPRSADDRRLDGGQRIPHRATAAASATRFRRPSSSPTT